MKAPLSWIKEYVDIDMSVEELSDKLLNAGFEVEGYEDFCKFSNVVVGKIIDIKPHFEADKLRVCTVDAGEQVLVIVTGAANVKINDYVPVAKIGAVLSGGKTIVEAELRGVKSYGMLCSGSELGIDDGAVLGASTDGILILNDSDCEKELVCGRDVAELLDLYDTILDISILSNRPDCQSIFGISREISALTKKPLKYPQVKFQTIDESMNGRLSVDVLDKAACPRYMARMVKNIKIEQSPRQMRLKLIKCGVRQINNIVDITNYVLLELGQPMHAFDLANIEKSKIIVRRAAGTEKITALDGKIYNLSQDMLVIADAAKPVAIAGVMGGEYSGVSGSTATVVFEAAKFARGQVRSQAKKLGLKTDSSARFEKGVDIHAVPDAMSRALHLVGKLKCGKVLDGEIDICVGLPAQRVIKCSTNDICSLLGISIKTQAIVKILKELHFKCEYTGTNLTVEVPKFRDDIEDHADLAEEVIRIYGYDNIVNSNLDKMKATTGGKGYKDACIDKVKSLMTAAGANEIVTYSFISPKSFQLTNEQDKLSRAITIRNPLSEDYSVMRMSLLSNMLSVIKTNVSRKNRDFMLFETGRIYLADKLPLDKLPTEKETLCIAYCGKAKDFYSIKSVTDSVLGHFGFTAEYKRKKYSFLHDGISAEIYADGVQAGYIGKVHPKVMANYEIEDDIIIAELDLELLIGSNKKSIKYRPLPKYPGIERDLAVVVSEDAETGRIIKAISQAAPLLEEVRIFDIYKGAQIEPGKMSVAFGLVFRLRERTMNDTEANEQMSLILKVLEEKFDGKIRT